MSTSIDSLDIQISASANSANSEISTLITRLSALQKSLTSVGGSGFKNYTNNASKATNQTKSFGSALNKMNNSANKTAKSTKSLAYAFGKFYANYFLFIRAFKGLFNSIESTADYIEAFNYFNVALGKIGSEWSSEFEKYGYESAEAYAESFNKRLTQTLGGLSGVQLSIGSDGNGLLIESGMKNLGLNIKEVTQYASQLASVTNSVGQTGEVSIAAANAFTKLGADISSLFNLDYSAVMTNLQSGLIGQSRALYKYGIDITNATLQTYAYELGLSKAVSEMTQAEKMQLRMIAILDQSKVSWGDLANTIESPSNLIRQFANNLKEAGMVLGQLFIPLLQKVLPVINGVTIAIKRLLVNIAGFLGISLDLSSFGQGYSDMADDASSLSDSLDDATASAKKLKTATLGIDELNINAPQDDTSGGSGAGISTIDLTDEIISATDEYQKVWQEAFDKMESKAQAFADTFEKMFKPIGNIFEDFAVGDYFEAGEDISRLAIGITDFMANAIAGVDWEKVGANVGDFLKGIKWSEIFYSLGNLVWEAINGAIEAWKGSFSAAPIETAILSAVLLLKFTGLGSLVAGNIVKAIATNLSAGTLINTLSAGFKALFGSAAAQSALAFMGGFSKFFTGIGSIVGGAITAISNFVNMFVNGFSWINEILMVVGVALTAVGAVILGAPALITAVIAGIVAAVGTLVVVIKENWEAIKDWTANLVESVGDFFSGLWKGIQLIWSAVPLWFEETVIYPLKRAWLLATTAIGNFFSNLWTSIKVGVVGAMNSVIGVIESAVNGIIGLLNGFMSGINWMVQSAGELLGKDWNDFALISEVKFGRIPAYQTGGFPEDGLFMANHNELVGQFSNGRTAVANNEQIVSGIKEGVREAVSEILAPYLSDIARNTRETADKDFSVNIGDRDIARANQRGQRSLGYQLVT